MSSVYLLHLVVLALFDILQLLLVCLALVGVLHSGRLLVFALIRVLHLLLPLELLFLQLDLLYLHEVKQLVVVLALLNVTSSEVSGFASPDLVAEAVSVLVAHTCHVILSSLLLFYRVTFDVLVPLLGALALLPRRQALPLQ